MPRFRDFDVLEHLAKLKRKPKLPVTKLPEFPKCDLCDSQAFYDGLTIHGKWGYMCKEHFTRIGVGLGLGKGQEIVVVRGGDVNEN